MQLNQDLVENGNGLSKKVINEKQDAIKKKQNDYVNYSKAINEKAAELEKELLEPVFTELNNKITDFGKAKGYEIIFGTLAGGNILYGNSATDLTEEFLSYASKN
jgi:outer membrane protein